MQKGILCVFQDTSGNWQNSPIWHPVLECIELEEIQLMTAL